jgi:hypothetical protein
MCAGELMAAEFPVLSGIRAGNPLLLKPVKSSEKVVYASAIAHKLAAQAPQSAPELAQQLVTELTRWLIQGQPPGFCLPLPLPATAGSALVVYTAADGLVYLGIGDRALALWLDSVLRPLSDGAIVPPEGTTVSTTAPAGSSQPAQAPRESAIESAVLFGIQHAHARCCSLLRLAHRTGTITLDGADAQAPQWQFRDAVPWLTTADELVLAHPAERQAVKTLFQAAVALQAPLPRRAGLAIAQDVAIAFAQWHRDRPLFAPPASLALHQAQFGLVLATQRLLYRWLKTLESVAPTSL